MNKLLVLLVTILTLSNDSFAARRKCVLKIELSDRSPITVAIDNRDYKKVGTSMTFGDLPTGRHYLRIYEYKEYKDGDGGHAKLIYTGSVKLKKNTITSCVVYPDNGEMVVTQNMMSDVPQANNSAAGTLSAQETTVLGNEVKAKVTDIDKMKLVQTKLARETYTTAQVREMLPWFNFEESRLEFAKWAYNNAIDKNNYHDIVNDLDYEASVKDFESFLSAAR